MLDIFVTSEVSRPDKSREASFGQSLNIRAVVWVAILPATFAEVIEFR